MQDGVLTPDQVGTTITKWYRLERSIMNCDVVVQARLDIKSTMALILNG